MRSDDREFVPRQDIRDDISISIVQFPVALEPGADNDTPPLHTPLDNLIPDNICFREPVNHNDNGKLFRVFRLWRPTLKGR